MEITEQWVESAQSQLLTLNIFRSVTVFSLLTPSRHLPSQS